MTEILGRLCGHGDLSTVHVLEEVDEFRDESRILTEPHAAVVKHPSTPIVAVMAMKP